MHQTGGPPAIGVLGMFIGGAVAYVVGTLVGRRFSSYWIDAGIAVAVAVYIGLAVTQGDTERPAHLITTGLLVGFGSAYMLSRIVNGPYRQFLEPFMWLPPPRHGSPKE